MLLDLAKLALKNLLCIFGLAEEESRRGLEDSQAVDAFALEFAGTGLDYDEAMPAQNAALGYAGVQNADPLNQAAYAIAETEKGD